VKAIDETMSPDPPNQEEELIEDDSSMFHLKHELNKDCPICLSFMTEPCRFPKQLDRCDHMICKTCMDGMFEQASK